MATGKGGHRQEMRFVVKQLNRLHRVRRLARYLAGLWAAGRLAETQVPPERSPTPADQFLLPRCLGVLYRWNAIAIEYLEGQNLKQLLPILDVESVLWQLGRCLAHFHRLPFRVSKRVTPAEELKECREAVTRMCDELPGAAAPARKLLSWLETHASSGSRPGLLHGSFRLNHVFLSENRLALFDLDSLRWGPAAYDLANLITSLFYLQAQGRIDGTRRQSIVEHFLAGYQTGTLTPVPAAELRWYLVSLLLNKQAFKYVNHAHADREQKVLAMLEIGEQITCCSLDKAKRVGQAGIALP